MNTFPLVAFSRIICYCSQNKQLAVIQFVRDFAYPHVEYEIADDFACHIYIKKYRMYIVLFASICIRMYTQINIGQSSVKASETKQRELKEVELFSNVSWKSII